MGTSHDESKLIWARKISYAFPTIFARFASKVSYSKNTHFVKLRMEIQRVLMLFNILLPFVSINFEGLKNS
jgi:hypothetical protein